MGKGIQFDSQIRVVGINNLDAFCDRVSGMFHRFWIDRVTKNRLYLAYSNPDEWGSDHPMIAVFPIYKGHDLDREGNISVVLDMLTVQHDNWNGEGWQAFDPIVHCIELWRDSPDSKIWKSKEEIDKSKDKGII